MRGSGKASNSLLETCGLPLNCISEFSFASQIGTSMNGDCVKTDSLRDSPVIMTSRICCSHVVPDLG